MTRIIDKSSSGRVPCAAWTGASHRFAQKEAPGRVGGRFLTTVKERVRRDSGWILGSIRACRAHA